MEKTFYDITSAEAQPGAVINDDNTTPIIKPIGMDETIDILVPDDTPPVKEFPADENTRTLTGTIYSGTVINESTGDALPNATVSFYSNGSLVGNVIANRDGSFMIDPETDITSIEVTHTGYEPRTFKAGVYANNGYYLMPLKIKLNELPDVVVTANRKNNDWIFWAVLTAAYLQEQNKRSSVGKIDTGTIVAAGAGVALLVGFSTIKKLFEGVGFWDSKDDKDIAAEKENIYSPWSPRFAENAPPGSLLLTTAVATNMINRIANAFGWFDDDENAIYAIFNELKTQSQLSSLSYHFSRMYSGTLLDWLTGTDEPGADHLSNEEVARINRIIYKLPKYTP